MKHLMSFKSLNCMIEEHFVVDERILFSMILSIEIII